MTAVVVTKAEQELEWPNQREDYEILNELGDGASAKVYRVLCKPNGLEVAAKIIDLDDTTAEIEDIQREMTAIRACRHDNIVPLYTTFVHKQSLWIVMKLLDCGSLLDIVKWKGPRSQNGVLEPGVIATILKAVLSALEYLHNQGQIHRDIKAGNILLHSDGTVQLADFGVSAWLAEDQFAAREARSGSKKGRKRKATAAERKTFVGTPCWMAPEVMLQKSYNDKADIWSLGITALELATGMAPYAQFDAMKVLKFTIENDPPTLDSYDGKSFAVYKKPLRKFVASCLIKDPDERPSASDLLKSDFIKKARDSKYVVVNLIEGLPELHTMRPYTQGAESSEEKPSSGRFTIDSWSFEDQPPAPAPAQSNPGVAPVAEQPPAAEPVAQTVHLRLRLRKLDQTELQDIKFEMELPNESCEAIAEELTQQGLVRAVDCAQVVGTMHALVDNPHLGALTFSLFGTTPEEGETGFEEGTNVLKAGFGQVFIGESAINPPNEVVPQAAPEADSPPTAASPEVPAPSQAPVPAEAPAAAEPAPAAAAPPAAAPTGAGTAV